MAVVGLVQAQGLIQTHALGDFFGKEQTYHDVCLFRCVWLRDLVDESLDLRGELIGKVEGRTSPEWPLLECSHVEPSDHAEIVSTTLQCLEEVRILFRVRIDDLARGQNDLVVHYVVANEALARTEEGKTS